MRLLFIVLSLVVAVAQKGLKGSKGQTTNCTGVLADFHAARDGCVGALGLSEWLVFAAPETTAPATSSPGTSAPGTSAPGTSAPATSAPATSAPATSAPGTSAPSTGAPSTASPGTSAPVTPEPPTPSPAMAACAPDGSCRAFINAAAMWRPQIEWCLRTAAEEITDELAAQQLTTELSYATALVNRGCSKNEMGDFCADGAFAALMEGGCPGDQEEVDTWVDEFGCCVASYAEASMARAALIEEVPCEGDFEIGKACKAPKWKLPKKAAAKAASKGKKGKIAGAVIGGVAGLGLIGFALRKRRAKLSTSNQPQKATGQVAMVSVPVAV